MFRLLSVMVSVCMVLMPGRDVSAQTRDRPIPMGTPATVANGKWRIVVDRVFANANDMVRGANRFNDPPKGGHQFFIAHVDATLLAPGSERFDGTYALRAVAASNVEYSTFRDSCGVIPDGLQSREVFSGGTVGGNVCWEILSSDAASMTMWYEDSSRNSDRVFFSLMPDYRPPPPPAPPREPTRGPAGTVYWTRGYPQMGASGCVEYVAQWSDGTYSSTPWDCGPGVVARRPGATATRGYPQMNRTGCVEYVTQWSDGTYSWVPFECPTGIVYYKP